MTKGFLKKPVSHVLLVIILCLIAYSNSFHVPFHFDGKDAIAENPIIKDFQFFTSPSKAKALTGHFGYHTFRSRYVGYLTFALNYSMHGLDTTGYHIVNLMIHVSTSMLLYLLALPATLFRQRRLPISGSGLHPLPRCSISYPL
jgi:hypothetical protein